jgi:hypothetical protein
MTPCQEHIENNKYYVYGLVNPIDGEIFYVGKGSGKRAYDHLKPSGWGNNSHKLNKIQKIRKNGMEPHVLFLYENLDEKMAFDMEIREINRLKKDGVNLTNMTNGGDCGPIRFGKRSKSERQIVAEKTKEAMWKEEIRERHLNSIRSESNRKRLSENQIQKLRTNKEWFEKFTKSNYKNEYRTRKVVRDDGVIFNSVEDVARFYGTRLNVITRHLNGKRKTYKNHVFTYLDI